MFGRIEEFRWGPKTQTKKKSVCVSKMGLALWTHSRRRGSRKPRDFNATLSSASSRGDVESRPGKNENAEANTNSNLELRRSQQVDRGGARGVHGGSALNGLILLLHSRAGRKILGASRGPLTSWPSSSWASRHCHCHCHCHRRRRRCRRRRPLRSRRCRCCRRRPRSRPRSP